jgi:ribosomal protein L40E
VEAKSRKVQAEDPRQLAIPGQPNEPPWKPKDMKVCGECYETIGPRDVSRCGKCTENTLAPNAAETPVFLLSKRSQPEAAPLTPEKEATPPEVQQAEADALGAPGS